MKVGMTLPTMMSLALNEPMLQAADACGMDSIWVPDHFLGVMHPELWSEFPASAMITDPDAWLDPFCVAAALGRSTHLPFGTCVTDGTRRRGADLARTALTLNGMCDGGFVLGIGAGEAESTLPFGYEFSQPVSRLEETLRDLRHLVDTGRMPEGIGRTGLPRESAGRKPQVWVAAGGPRALRLCGRYGDGWMQGPVPAAVYAEQLALLRRSAADAGREVPTACLFPLVLFGESRAQVAATFEANPLLKLLLLLAPGSLWSRYGLEHPSGAECRGVTDYIPHALQPARLRQLAPTIPIEMCEEFIMFGSVEDVAQRLRPYAAAGANYMVLCDLTGLCYAPEKSAQLIAGMGALKRMLNATSH